MTNKQAIYGVSRELLQHILANFVAIAPYKTVEIEELRALLENPVLESQYDGMSQAQAQAVSDGVDEMLHGKPAAQPQGEVEPVAYRYMNCNTGTYGPTKDGGIYYAEIPEYGREWEVTTKAHGAVLVERKEHAIASGYADSHPSRTVVIEPLYPHADSGEVERLREENERLLNGFYQQVTDADLKKIADFVGDDDLPTKSFFMRPDAAYLANVTMHMVREVQSSRAQLAERDVLLHEWVAIPRAASSSELNKVRCKTDHLLSTSAEPTKQEAWALQVEKDLGIERLPAEPKPRGEAVECVHDWTDDGEFTLTCTKCGKAESHEPYGWVQTRGNAINHFTQEWDVVESWEDQGFEYKPMFDHAEQPSHSGDANEMVAKVVLPECYSLAMFQMISGFESVTPEQFDLVWSACRAEAARLNGIKP